MHAERALEPFLCCGFGFTIVGMTPGGGWMNVDSVGGFLDVFWMKKWMNLEDWMVGWLDCWMN